MSLKSVVVVCGHPHKPGDSGFDNMTMTQTMTVCPCHSSSSRALHLKLSAQDRGGGGLTPEEKRLRFEARQVVYCVLLGLLLGQGDRYSVGNTSIKLIYYYIHTGSRGVESNQIRSGKTGDGTPLLLTRCINICLHVIPCLECFHPVRLVCL